MFLYIESFVSHFWYILFIELRLRSSRLDKDNFTVRLGVVLRKKAPKNYLARSLRIRTFEAVRRTRSSWSFLRHYSIKSTHVVRINPQSRKTSTKYIYIYILEPQDGCLDVTNDPRRGPEPTPMKTTIVKCKCWSKTDGDEPVNLDPPFTRTRVCSLLIYDCAFLVRPVHQWLATFFAAEWCWLVFHGRPLRQIPCFQSLFYGVCRAL